MRKWICAALMLTLLCAQCPWAVAEDMPVIEDQTFLDDINDAMYNPDGGSTASGDEYPQDYGGAYSLPETSAPVYTLGMPAVSKTTAGDVRALQRALIAAGNLEGEADGMYGTMTEDAASEWFAQHGQDLEGDSPFALLVRMRRIAPASDPSSDRATVYVAQRLLHLWGFLRDAPDGSNGKNTQAALARFMKYTEEPMRDFLRDREQASMPALPSAVSNDEMPVVIDEPLNTSVNLNTDGTLSQDWYDFITSGFTPDFVAPALDTKSTDALRVQNRLFNLKYLAAGTDGTFGKNTARALKYFQLLNGLKETGKCNANTAQRLFSEDAVESDKYVSPYMARVTTAKSKVDIIKWTGKGYTKTVKTFTCSCGKPSTPTAHGTFQAKGPVTEWYFMPTSNVWVKYAFQIKGNYFFHSVLFSSKGAKNPTSSSVRNLGSNVSHGCVRLSVKDAEWLFKNCVAGMTVVIQ